MGYYTVDGISGVLPTLTVEIGTTYTWSQAQLDAPYWVSLQPDGAHDGEGSPEVTDGSGTTGYVYMYYVKSPGASAFTAVAFG